MSGIIPGSVAKTCFFWNRNGECKHGEGCHFLHRKTGVVADPPKSWTDYGERGPPKKARGFEEDETGGREDGDDDGGGGGGGGGGGDGSDWVPSAANDWEQASPVARNERHQAIVEDEWDRAIPGGAGVAASDWDTLPPPVPKARGKSGEWDQAPPPNLVDNWYPPAPKVNGAAATPNTPSGRRSGSMAAASSRYQDSVAASTTPHRYASSAAASNNQDSAGASSSPAHGGSPAAAVEDIWDTLLPPEFAEYTSIKRKYGTSDSEFDLDSLVVLLSAMPFRLLDVEQYLNTYAEADVRRAINTTSSKITALFFAVATNEPRALKLLIEKGGDVNSTAGADAIPVLAFAIMHGSREDTTEMVRILLAHGADSSVIPDEFVAPDIRSAGSPASSGATQWCTKKYRSKLASTVNITQQYWLARSRQQRPRTARELMVARTEGCQKLFQISYSLVGQEFATGLLMKRVSSHVLLPKVGSKPLVVVFAGASGHGKTELAKSMGALLSVDSLTLDAAEMSHVSDLVGPRAPFPGHEEGSVLNNFLCRNHGQRAVVFLDNFKAMGTSVFDSLLIPFSEGKYRDHRTARSDAEIDCTKVIWILATSEVDNIIEPYYRAHTEALQNPSSQSRVVSVLANEISNKFLKRFSLDFGPTFAGRISLVLPFFPFSPTEQAVLAHKYILALKRVLAADIDVASAAFMGHIKLDVEGEAAVCRLLARSGYTVEYGARAIEREVEAMVRDAVTDAWMRCPEDVTDQSNGGPFERYCLAVHPSGDYVHVKKQLGRGARAKGKAKANGGGVRPGSAVASPVGRPGPRTKAKVGRLIDIGGEIMKSGWEA